MNQHTIYQYFKLRVLTLKMLSYSLVEQVRMIYEVLKVSLHELNEIWFSHFSHLIYF